MKKETFKRNLLSILMLSALGISGQKAYAQTSPPPFPPLLGGKSVTHPASDYKFSDTKIRGVDGKTKIMSVDAYDNPSTGQHLTFSKFDGGFVSKVHSHTYDYYAIVIKGELENYEVGVKPVKLGPGSYLYQRGKKAHTTACVSKGGCLILVTQSIKMDNHIPPQEM